MVSKENLQHLIFVALVAAKSLDPLEVVPVLRTRGNLMQKCCEGKEGSFGSDLLLTNLSFNVCCFD